MASIAEGEIVTVEGLLVTDTPHSDVGFNRGLGSNDEFKESQEGDEVESSWNTWKIEGGRPLQEKSRLLRGWEKIGSYIGPAVEARS